MIVIGDKQFHVPPPGGMRSFGFQQRILPVAGRVANVFLKLIGAGQGEYSKLAGEDIMRVLPVALPEVGEVFSHMPPGELEVLARTLLGDPKTGAAPGEAATCDKMPLFGGGVGDAFDGLMRGRTVDTWKLLWHAVEVWYPDFFAGARSFLAQAGEAGSGSAGSSTSPTPGPASA